MSINPDTLTRPMMTEKQLLQCVLDAARLFGWSAYHVHDSRRSMAGYPDVVAVRSRPGSAPRLLYAELKSDRGRLTEAQRTWLADLARVADCAAVLGMPSLVTVCVWRPADWLSGDVERVLREA